MEQIVDQQDMEVIIFTHFLSDYDPSLVLLLSYNPTKKCSYLKMLKIYNQIEHEDDWSNNEANEVKTFSMYEDEAKEKLIQNIRNNLQNDPSM